jgi:hypothetical protein
MTLWWCLLVALIVRSPLVPDKPDFSGQWILVNPSDASSGSAQELIVRQSARRESVLGTRIDPPFITLAVERHFESGMRSETYPIGIIGGTVGGLDKTGRGSGPSGRVARTSYSTKWDGDKLVIENSSYSGPTPESGPYTEHVEVWSLDAEGRLLMAVTDRSSIAGRKTTMLTYRRR